MKLKYAKLGAQIKIGILPDNKYSQLVPLNKASEFVVVSKLGEHSSVFHSSNLIGWNDKLHFGCLISTMLLNFHKADYTSTLKDYKFGLWADDNYECEVVENDTSVSGNNRPVRGEDENPFCTGDVVCTINGNRYDGVVKNIACAGATLAQKRVCDRFTCDHQWAEKTHVWVEWANNNLFNYHYSELELFDDERKLDYAQEKIIEFAKLVNSVDINNLTTETKSFEPLTKEEQEAIDWVEYLNGRPQIPDHWCR